MTEADPGAAPLVVWEGSAEVLRAALARALAPHPPETWGEVDLTEAYAAARREVFAIWLFGKLVLVTGLVALHAWIGHTIVAVAETDGRHQPPEALVPSLILALLVIGVLTVVLAKPELEELPIPALLLEPLGRQLPFDVPNR